MKNFSIRAVLAIVACALVQASLMTAQAADFKAAKPRSTVGAFKSTGGGTSQAQPGTYCCTIGGQCTPHGALAVCVGSDYIRWECKADGSCSRVPFGGDN